MSLCGTLTAPRPSLSLLHDPSTRAAVLYLVLSPSASLTATWIGSLSEYRFPHPLTTTCLHLALALVILLVSSIAAQLALRIRPRRRGLATHSSTSPSPSSLSPLYSLASLTSPPSLTLPPPSTLLASLSAVLSSLLELRLSRSASSAFLSFTKLLPLLLASLLSFVLPARSITRGGRLKHALLGLVLFAGAGVSAAAHLGEWVLAVGWAGGMVGWVAAVQARVGGMEAREARWRRGRGADEAGEELEKVDERRGSPPSPSLPSLLLTHLLLTLLLLPLLSLSPLSHELAAIRRYRHYGFFTEPGFWAQEGGMAACEVVRLGAFLNLVKSSPSSLLPCLSLPAVSSLLLRPLLTHLLFGNPLASDSEPMHRGGGRGLGEWAQLGLVGVTTGWAVSEGGGAGEGEEEGRKCGDGRRRRKEG
ncbi:hypothetical protein JCM6882_004981 [Rhodosporidiobolus microsporus]